MDAIRYPIYQNDRQYLRELALYQAELAHLPGMQERTSDWILHNDLKSDRPMVTIENRTFAADILPPLQCKGKTAKVIEHKLLSVVYGYLFTQDDRVVPDFYAWIPDINMRIFGLELVEHRAKDQNQRTVGFKIDHPITDLESQVHDLGPSVYDFDRALFEEERVLAEEIFGDILPVKFQCLPVSCYLTKHIVDLMGMEEMMYAFYDCPDEMHLLVQKIEKEYQQFFDYLEASDLLVPNNDNVLVKMGTFGFTEDLPGREQLAGQSPKLKQLWGHLNSQETVSISPAMFNEFFLDSYIRLAKRFGLYTYGCCEPVDRIWDSSLIRMPDGLRKLSISPWCNEEFIGERLRGSRIMYHRKPAATFIGVGDQLDEDAFAEHIKRTLLAAKGCKLEISMRDIYTLGADKMKAVKAMEITRNQIDRYWQP